MNKESSNLIATYQARVRSLKKQLAEIEREINETVGAKLRDTSTLGGLDKIRAWEKLHELAVEFAEETIVTGRYPKDWENRLAEKVVTLTIGEAIGEDEIWDMVNGALD